MNRPHVMHIIVQGNDRKLPWDLEKAASRVSILKARTPAEAGALIRAYPPVMLLADLQVWDAEARQCVEQVRAQIDPAAASPFIGVLRFEPDAAFSMDSVAGPAPSGAPGVEQDFEDEMVGAMPSGWEGSYPFASLTVKGDTPPRGAQQYLCFEKKEGAGKAFFSRRFPSISGKVAIEFDLRCNDKNKFLLGIYVEKGGDFQQAIHTKILRSEAQTTPTIHMQGESAPYLQIGRASCRERV